MSDAERQDVLAQRQFRGGSWRRPPVWELGSERYLITAACYEHAPYIVKTPVRLSEFETSLLSAVDSQHHAYTRMLFCQITIICS